MQPFEDYWVGKVTIILEKAAALTSCRASSRKPAKTNEQKSIFFLYN